MPTPPLFSTVMTRHTATTRASPAIPALFRDHGPPSLSLTAPTRQVSFCLASTCFTNHLILHPFIRTSLTVRSLTICFMVFGAIFQRVRHFMPLKNFSCLLGFSSIDMPRRQGRCPTLISNKTELGMGLAHPIPNPHSRSIIWNVAE